jgi:hypothetical protein
MAAAIVPCSLAYLALFTAPELWGLELASQVGRGRRRQPRPPRTTTLSR